MEEFDFDGDDEDDLMAATMSIDMDNKFNPITLGAINSCGRDKQFEKGTSMRAFTFILLLDMYI